MNLEKKIKLVFIKLTIKFIINQRERDIMTQKDSDPQELYENSKEEGIHPNLHNPDEWLLNQDENRQKWEKYVNDIKNSEYLYSLLTKTAYYKYVDFMYKTYPPGYEN